MTVVVTVVVPCQSGESCQWMSQPSLLFKCLLRWGAGRAQ